MNIFLSGEIHTDWRQQIADGIASADLPVTILSSVTDHESSDDCGARVFGEEPDPFWRDHKSAKLNGIRTKLLLENADIVVVRFGEKYRQWNAAFDAGVAVALGIPLISLHQPELTHALKEIDASAHAVAETPKQVVGALEYILKGTLPR